VTAQALRADGSPLGAVAVEELGPGLETTWDEFVRASPDGSPFHRLGWRRSVEAAFRHEPIYFVARRATRIVGVLPLFRAPILFSGHALISVPFGIRGGVLADDAAAARALASSALGCAHQRRALHVELRSAVDRFTSLPRREGYVTFRADLRESESALLRRMDRKRRQMLSHAARAGYSVTEVGHDRLALFYDLFARSMRRHGTPVLPRRFVAAVARELADVVRLFVLEHASRPLMCVLALVDGGVVMPFWAGRSDRRRAAEELLYWEMMRWGKERGCHTFDFGRSRRGTGAAAFKARGGMEETPLDYRVAPVVAAHAPRVDPGNPRFAPMIAVWRRLPLALTRRLGPLLAGRIP
jgi:FemAB-related protein (PEP-CTERM system-associated)